MEEATYPHEIGIFLGYPLEDVLGFIQLVFWKVYDQNSVTRSRNYFHSLNMFVINL